MTERNASRLFARSLFFVGAVLAAFLALDRPTYAALVFWADSAGIHRVNSDGTGRIEVAAPTQYLYDMSADVGAGKLYWTEGGSGFPGSIHRVNFDGSGEQTVLSNLGGLNGIGVDAPHNQFFWSGYVNGASGLFTLHRTSLDGSSTQDAFDTGAPDVDGIVVDSAAGKLYRFDYDNQYINRYNLDGTGVELIAPEATNMAVDLVAGKIYFDDFFNLRRANLDGSNPETLAGIPLNQYPIDVDHDGGKLYYADYNLPGVARSNLDGSGYASFVLGATNPRAVLVVNPVPEPSTWVLGTIGLSLLLIARRRLHFND